MPSQDPFIDALVSLEPIKTWSLIVTMFGDVAPEPVLTGRQIGQLLELIGVKPEAVRVALHRLKKDGWITSKRSGREVAYHLSNNAVEETRAVYAQIYQNSPKFDEGWQLVLCADDQKEVSQPNIRLAKQLALMPTKSVPDNKDNVRLDVAQPDLPTWLEASIVPSKSLEQAQSLYAIAQQIRAQSTPTDLHIQAAIRLLLLHHWRKIALRDASWAHMWLFPTGAIKNCQSIITELLDDWPQISVTTS